MACIALKKGLENGQKSVKKSGNLEIDFEWQP